MSWLKPRYSRDTEPRERYGPMDIDEPNPLSRLEQYAVQDNDYGEGPSRKRLHSDIHTPTRPFTSNNKTIHVTPSTPFLFNISNLQVPDLPAQRSFQYDPTDFQGPNKLDWGFGKVENRFGIEDVEMSESPVKPGWASHLSFDPPLDSVSAAVKAAGKEENMEQVDDSPDNFPPISREDEKKEEEKVTSEYTDGDQMLKSDTEKTQNTNRVYATGGVKREMRNRSKKKQNRNENNTREKEEYRRVDPAHSLKHSEIPALILGYIQVFVNVAIVIFALYLGIHLVLTIQRDVKDRMQEASLEMRQEIAECTKLFVTNRCDPEFRVPAMEDHCRNWETCMNRDPTMVGRINVMAETFAGVINSFVEAMSWKTMGFTLATLSFLIILTNSALWNLRQKASPDPSHPPPVYMLPHPSLTRQLQIGNHISHLGQTMGSVGQPLDWHGMMGDSNVKQIEYGEKKKKWGIW